MRSKSELVKTLEVKNYGYKEVKHLIESVTQLDEGDINMPSKIIIGDVLKIYSCTRYPRPAVVIAVRKNFVFYATLSTTEDAYNLIEGDSRFFGNGYINKQVSVCTLEFAKENFIGVYGNNKKIKEAKKELKKFYKGIL